MIEAIQSWANTLLGVVIITAVCTFIVVAWYEIRQSKQRENYYRGRQWNEDEGGAP